MRDERGLGRLGLSPIAFGSGSEGLHRQCFLDLRDRTGSAFEGSLSLTVDIFGNIVAERMSLCLLSLQL